MQLQEEEIKLTCSRCGIVAGLEGFHKDKTKRHGRSYVCKPCASDIASEYYRKNHEKIKARTSAWARRNNYSYAQLGIYQRLKNCVTRSKLRKKWQNDLDDEFLHSIWEKQDGKCALTGRELTYEANHPFTASIDRIDSSKGYLRDNVQLVGKVINIMKSDLPQDDFIEICKVIARKHS